jgi:hypothetical protein
MRRNHGGLKKDLEDELSLFESGSWPSSRGRLEDEVVVSIHPARPTSDIAAVRIRMLRDAGAHPNLAVDRMEDRSATTEGRSLSVGGVERV